MEYIRKTMSSTDKIRIFVSPYACEQVLSRKRELDEEGISTINSKIDYLAGKKGYTKVLNESTPQVAVNEILTFVFNELHKKNLKRLR